jgi:hypothetical protein
MENAPVIRMIFSSATPGTEREITERYLKWVNEVYLRCT